MKYRNERENRSVLMKINVIGAGTMGSTIRCNQSILVGDVLFDVGSGVVKKIEQLGLATKDINYIVLTHSHADHFCDLPNFLIGRGIRGENSHLLHIICGKGLRNKTIELFKLTFGDGIPDKYDNFEEKFNVEFVELENDDVYETDEFKITAFDLEHGTCKPILGYLFEKDGQVLGYATDTTLCDNVKIICSKSDVAFLDATAPVSSRMHMGVEDVINLAKEYPKTIMYAIHRADYEFENITEISFPEDGDVIEV